MELRKCECGSESVYSVSFPKAEDSGCTGVLWYTNCGTCSCITKECFCMQSDAERAWNEGKVK